MRTATGEDSDGGAMVARLPVRTAYMLFQAVEPRTRATGVCH
jgi:hypothetical protein